MSEETVDLEFKALETILGALLPLDDEQKARVLAYFVARFKIDPGVFT